MHVGGNTLNGGGGGDPLSSGGNGGGDPLSSRGGGHRWRMLVVAIR